MKIFHLSDLHIGKQLHYYNLGECQKRMLDEIVEQVNKVRPDVIVIAGDIYDKAVPSGEAYQLFDRFLNGLADIEPNIPVLIIAGNHDNAKRLQYAGNFLERNQIYVSAMPPSKEEERLKKITLKDVYGEVHFYLLPFTKPGYVRHLFEEGVVKDYHTAIQALLEREQIDTSQRNVLVAHQFFVANGEEPSKSDSELTYISVGGLDWVDVSCVRDFDYVALGHIHRAQKMGEENIRYCGTPYKYSVGEENDKKGILVVTLGEKGTEPAFETIPLFIKPDVRSIRGSLLEVLEAATEENCQDYVSITLTDDQVLLAKESLEVVYPHILEVRVDNVRTRKRLEDKGNGEKSRSPMEAFADFYREMNDIDMSEEEEQILQDIIEEVKERTGEL